MDLGKGLGHLTYSTLVHPGDNWSEIWNSLTTYVPRVKERIAPKERFGVSLRLAAETAQTLVSNRADSAARRKDTPKDRKSTRLNSSHEWISYAVFCVKKK